MDRRIAEARRRRRIQRNIRLGVLVLAVLIVLVGIVRIIKPAWFTNDYIELKGKDIDASRPDLDVELLTENP